MSGAIHWLASYPKSGNTWTRVLFTNYLRDDDEPADINELDGGPIASARAVFDEHVGIEASDLTQDEIERLRPRVYEHVSSELLAAQGEGDDPMLMKVHDAITLTADGVPLIPAAATAGAIYLLRDPRDVVESFAHHNARDVETMVGRMADPSMAFVDRGSRLHNQLRQRLLTWSGHVESWVDHTDFPVLVVRYEDLADDTVAVFTEMVRFVGLDPDADRVRRAVEFSAFGRLQAQEVESGFGEKMPRASSFFRQGKARAWESSLAPELARRIEADQATVMKRFGYLPDEADG